MNLQRKMLLIRLIEDRLQTLCREGLAGDLHFNKGQEAIAVGVCAALQPSDKIATHHRTIAHYLSKLPDTTPEHIYPLIAELLGRNTGINGGRAGEMHISNHTIGYEFSFQLVGTCLPVATGIAWALKHFHKTRDIVACFFGDAASSNGQFHEACTIAAVQKVPLLLVCENNGRAGNITKEYYMPPAIECVSERMSAYGIPSWRIPGQDVEFVKSEAESAASLVRETGCPLLLEITVERLCHHKQGQGDIRTKEELAEASLRDPLLELDKKTRKQWTEEINAELDPVFAKALADPVADLEIL